MCMVLFCFLQRGVRCVHAASLLSMHLETRVEIIGRSSVKVLFNVGAHWAIGKQMLLLLFALAIWRQSCRSCARGSPKRQQMFDEFGKFQVRFSFWSHFLHSVSVKYCVLPHVQMRFQLAMFDFNSKQWPCKSIASLIHRARCQLKLAAAHNA